jgi:hypothetical protein
MAETWGNCGEVPEEANGLCEGKIQSANMKGRRCKTKNLRNHCLGDEMLGTAERPPDSEERKPYANHNGDDDFVPEVEDDVPM